MKDKFEKIAEQPNLYLRNGRYYAQVSLAGRGVRRIPLLDGSGSACLTLEAALTAKRSIDETSFPLFSDRYLAWLDQTKAKSPLTITRERGILAGWKTFLGWVKLAGINRALINDYAAKRSKAGLSPRAVNLDVLVLNNLLQWAKGEGVLTGELPTADWKPLKYTPPSRSLVAGDVLQGICNEALKTDTAGKPLYRSGAMLVDLVKFMAYSGARKQAALSARWENVDLSNQQLTLFTKFDRRVVVDFNPKLAGLLQEMASRDFSRSEWLFPGTKGHWQNCQDVFKQVLQAAGLPNVRFHDLRHYFISHAIMSGTDTLTVASWVGHKDGGVLIGKVYGHLNPQHKREAAAKVQFGA
jgi:integrase